MRQRIAFTLAAVIVGVLSTLLAYTPVWRSLYKMDPEIAKIARGFFWRDTVPCLAVAFAAIVLSAYLWERRPRIAIVLLIAAPIAAFLTDLILWLGFSQ